MLVGGDNSLLCGLQVLQELIGSEKKFVSVMEELLDTYLSRLEANDSLYVCHRCLHIICVISIHYYKLSYSCKPLSISANFKHSVIKKFPNCL